MTAKIPKWETNVELDPWKFRAGENLQISPQPGTFPLLFIIAANPTLGLPYPALKERQIRYVRCSTDYFG